ncbi:MAG: hypothetical protein QG597_1020 [Actinomycetota bacterium]|nr:hypothetical protein [Actinomycetota bacterium]
MGSPGTTTGSDAPAPIVYLHGKGEPKRDHEVVIALSRGLDGIGQDPMHPAVLQMKAMDYSRELRGRQQGDGRRPLRVPRHEGGPRSPDQILAYFARQEALRQALVPHADDVWTVLDKAPRSIAAVGGDLMAWWYDDVDQYVKQEPRRWTVWSRVLDDWPKTPRVLVIAHSLGSVVIVDLLPRLPAGQRVDLVTLGSPLQVPRLRRGLRDLQLDFPYEQINSWVNIMDPDDWVPAVGGLSSALAQVLDVKVDLWGGHDELLYLAHPATARAVQAYLDATTAANAANP